MASIQGPPDYGEHLGTYGVASRSAGGVPQLGSNQVFRVPRGAPDGVLYGGEHSESISGSGCIPGGC